MTLKDFLKDTLEDCIIMWIGIGAFILGIGIIFTSPIWILPYLIYKGVKK